MEVDVKNTKYERVVVKINNNHNDDNDNDDAKDSDSHNSSNGRRKLATLYSTTA